MTSKEKVGCSGLIFTPYYWLLLKLGLKKDDPQIEEAAPVMESGYRVVLPKLPNRQERMRLYSQRAPQEAPPDKRKRKGRRKKASRNQDGIPSQDNGHVHTLDGSSPENNRAPRKRKSSREVIDEALEAGYELKRKRGRGSHVLLVDPDGGPPISIPTNSRQKTVSLGVQLEVERKIQRKKNRIRENNHRE